MSYIDVPQAIQYQSIIRRIITCIGEFAPDFSGSLPSGETARLQFDLEVNGTIIYTWYIDYDESDEDDIVLDEILSEVISSGQTDRVQPGDIIKVNVTEDYPDGYSFIKDNISVKVLCSKIYHEDG